MGRRARVGTLAVARGGLVVLGVLADPGTLSAKGIAGVAHPADGTIAVTAKSPFTFDPNTFANVPTNTTVTVTLTNGDSIPHTFTILDREGYVIKTSDSLSALLTTYGNLTNVVADGGTTATGSFPSPGPGWYEFVCTEPGHFAAGMYGFIAFGEALPSNLSAGATSSGPGIAVFIITGTIVALVVIALVLGFVVGRRRGAEHEMPPERLGYPEPVAPAGAPSEPPARPTHPK